MNTQESQIVYDAEHIEKLKRGNLWFVIVIGLLSIPLIIIGIVLLIFASITLAGAAFLLVTILLLILGLSLLVTAGVYLIHSSERVETRHFLVKEHPRIVVNNEVGSIHIKAARDANAVTFQTKRHSRWVGKTADESWVSYEHSKEENEIRADVERVYSPDTNLPQRIDFTITLPHNVDLELHVDVGDIWVTGIHGQLTVQDNIGSIYIKEGLLSGNSVLRTNLGSINFHEALDPAGSFWFATETGSVYVIVPDETPFELDAGTKFGTITTVVPHMKMAYRTNSEVHGDAGSGPRASLKLSSITGAVCIYEESDGRIPNWDENESIFETHPT